MLFTLQVILMSVFLLGCVLFTFGVLVLILPRITRRIKQRRKDKKLFKIVEECRRDFDKYYTWPEKPGENHRQ
jgi:hypothetical protein